MKAYWFLLLFTVISAISADTSFLFSNMGVGKSRSADSSTNLTSVIGQSINGTAKDSNNIVSSNYFTLPFVYAMMFNEAPTLISSDSVSPTVGSTWAYTAEAVDPEMDLLTYKFTKVPKGFYVNPNAPNELPTVVCPRLAEDITNGRVISHPSHLKYPPRISLAL